MRIGTTRNLYTAPYLTLLLMLILSACGGGQSAPGGSTAAGTTEVIGSTPAPSDGGTDTPASSTTGEATASRRYHPGHYIALNEGDGQSAMLLAIKPGVVGLQKRYYWRDLEPSPGVYDFSAIASDLQLLADHGMQLVAMIQDKTFVDMIPTPDYLRDYTVANTQGGYIAVRWSPYVVQRLSALTQKLGEAFGKHPNFEGIAFQESSVGLSSAVEAANGYTPEAYRDALTRILLDTRAHLPEAQVFWYMNFIEGNNGYLTDIATAVAPSGIVMGGPDVLPDNYSLNTHTYPLYDQFKGLMPLFGSIQYGSYCALHTAGDYATKYWTMQELFEFARDRLHVNYMFWTRKIKSNPEDSYNWLDALPVIAQNGNFN